MASRKRLPACIAAHATRGTPASRQRQMLQLIWPKNRLPMVTEKVKAAKTSSCGSWVETTSDRVASRRHCRERRDSRSAAVVVPVDSAVFRRSCGGGSVESARS